METSGWAERQQRGGAVVASSDWARGGKEAACDWMKRGSSGERPPLSASVLLRFYKRSFRRQSVITLMTSHLLPIIGITQDAAPVPVLSFWSWCAVGSLKVWWANLKTV